MKLSIQEALKRGINHHQDGDLNNASFYYKSIIKVQPKHPDANHNLGVIALSVGKTADSLNFFLKAIESNPKFEQYWVSYINVLSKLKKKILLKKFYLKLYY